MSLTLSYFILFLIYLLIFTIFTSFALEFQSALTIFMIFCISSNCSPVIKSLNILYFSNFYNLETDHTSHLITASICNGPDSYIRNYFRLRIMTSLLRVVKVFQNTLSKSSWLILCMLMFVYILVETMSTLFSSFPAVLSLGFLHQYAFEV